MVEAVPRVGTVVKGRPPIRRRDSELTKDRIVRAATEIADVEGLAALSMRAIADRLGVTTMAPYRHVANKEDLVLLMIDAAMGEDEYPAQPPDGWRARLELAAHKQWAVYRRHPWPEQAISLTRPQILHNALVHGEFMLSALEELNLVPHTRFHIYLTVFNHVRGTAVNLQWEHEDETASGLTTASGWRPRPPPSTNWRPPARSRPSPSSPPRTSTTTSCWTPCSSSACTDCSTASRRSSRGRP